jgi:hypothetical protein
MKTTKITIAIILLLTLFSCRTKVETEKLANRSTSLSKTSDCSCTGNYINPRCEDCVNKFMVNKAKRDYTINWTGCATDEPDPNNICNIAGKGLISTATFCYGNKPVVGDPDPECSLFMFFAGAPPCVSSCISASGSDFCTKLKANCVNDGKDIDFSLVSTGDDPNIITMITWTIVGDPIITICWTKVIGNVTYKSCYTGQII